MSTGIEGPSAGANPAPVEGVQKQSASALGQGLSPVQGHGAQALSPAPGGVLEASTAIKILDFQDLLAKQAEIQQEMQLVALDTLKAFLCLAHAQEPGVVGIHLVDEDDDGGKSFIRYEFIQQEEGFEQMVDASAVGLGTHHRELSRLGALVAEGLHTTLLDVSLRMDASGEISYTQQWPKLA